MRHSEGGSQYFGSLPRTYIIIVLQDFVNQKDHFSYIQMIFCAVSAISKWNILTQTHTHTHTYTQTHRVFTMGVIFGSNGSLCVESNIQFTRTTSHMCHSSMLICFPFENFVPFMSPLQIFKILFPPFTEKKKSNTMYVKQQK